MRTKDIGRSSNDKTVWWKVDLGGVFNIYSINILFKNYDGFGMNWLNFMKIKKYDRNSFKKTYISSSAKSI